MAITRAVANATATSAQFNEIIDHLEGASGSTLAYFLRVLGSNNFTIRLPDAGGTQEFRVQDSAGVTVASIDSDGNVAFAGTQATTGNTTLTANLTVGGNADVAGTLELGSSNITTSTAAGLLKHEAGGLEFDASAITTGGILKGDSSGVMEILPKGAASYALIMASDASDFAWTALPSGEQDTYLFKDAAETVNNSTTLQDDDDLYFTMTANKIYAFQYALLATGNSSSDLKINIDVASSGAADYFLSYANTGGTATAEMKWQGENTSVFTDGSWHQTVSATATGVLVCDGSDRLVKLQWAQSSAHASNTQLLIGSWFSYRQLN